MPIDEKEIISKFKQINLEPNNEGIISAFGVHLTLLPADYYNEVAIRFLEEFRKKTSEKSVMEAAFQLLVEAAHVCGFNTLGGIMLDSYWKEQIEPYLNTPEDWLKAILAIINLMGWGHYVLQELIPGEKMTVKIENSAEGEFFKKHSTEVEGLECFFAIGILQAVMHLIYVGRIYEKPELDDEFYEKLFFKQKVFKGKETKCVGKGAEECVITIEKV